MIKHGNDHNRNAEAKIWLQSLSLCPNNWWREKHCFKDCSSVHMIHNITYLSYLIFGTLHKILFLYDPLNVSSNIYLFSTLMFNFGTAKVNSWRSNISMYSLYQHFYNERKPSQTHNINPKRPKVRIFTVWIQSNNNLQTHVISVHEGKKFLCPQCEFKATQKGYIQQHIKSVHEGQKFPCPQCEYKATLKVNLQTHIKSIHEGQKFQCPHCEHKATLKGHLTSLKSLRLRKLLD